MESKRSPKKSSPGSDGLPYEILHLIMLFVPFQPVILKVYNDALEKSVFPKSWNDSIMSLLPKKGNLSNLKNYRPISLANTDYKIFTRILNTRIMPIADDLINNQQLGFLPGRYIAENGLSCQIIMEDAFRKKQLKKKHNIVPIDNHDIGLLLDQEKAYDRVNLDYLSAVLLRFGFPQPLVTCINNLMGQNRIQININGFFTDDVLKLRGLKQGDPISPILYNLAFEPFLRSILNDSLFKGYNMLPDSAITRTDSQVGIAPPINAINTKILCYADDALVLLHDTDDLARLSIHMDLFCQASNAKFNFNKIEAFTLSGHNSWNYWQQALEALQIHKLVSATDPEPVIYLGLPMIQSVRQRTNFVHSMVQKLKTALQPHLSRSLSVVGKATVLNSLILSKCWYIFRVTPLTQKDLKLLTSVGIQFCKVQTFPAIAWSIWTGPTRRGGLGVLDPRNQYLALSLRWLLPLLEDTPAQTSLTLMLQLHINNRNSSLYHQIPLLFPQTRQVGFSTERLNTIDMLNAAIDCIPRNFDGIHVTPATALSLPLTSFLTPEFDVQWGTSPRLISTRLLSGSLVMSPFFQVLGNPTVPIQFPDPNIISFKPFVQALSLSGMPVLSLPSKQVSKHFRKNYYQVNNTLPSSLTQIRASFWNTFWSLSLVAVQRNVVFRFLTGSIPNRAFLFRIFPEKFTSPSCTICGLEVETTKHMLFDCPPKSFVWKNIIFEFLWPTVTIPDIITALSSMNFHDIRYVQKSGSTAQMVVYITLANIWKGHFRSSFDSTPFLGSIIFLQTKKDIASRLEEGLIHSRL